MVPPLLKRSLSVVNKIGAVYTGGKVALSQDNDFIFCTCGEVVNVLDAKSGKVLHSIKHDDDEVTCFSLSPDDQILVVAYRSLLLRQWNWREDKCTRTWKAIHTAPIISMAFDSTSTLLATGSGDKTIKIWDVIQQYCTHNLKGSQAVVSYLKFHPDPTKLMLFSCAGSYIYVWDLQGSRLKVGLETHYGTVTSLDFDPDGNTMVSSGRDKIVVTWDLGSLQPTNTIPVMEAVESVFWIPADYHERLGFTSDNPVFMIAGSQGILRGVNSVTGQVVYQQTTAVTTVPMSENNAETTGIITHAQVCQKISQLMLVTYDHHILFFNVDGGDLHKQLVGFNDEVLDVRFSGSNDSHLVVATNCEYVKVYDLTTLNCQFLRGHTDIVLAVEVFDDRQMLASSSKDNTIRLWKMNDSCQYECKYVAIGHTHSIGCVATSRLSSSFLVSGSEDCTLKVWNIPEDMQTTDSPHHLSVRFTERAHEKDINSVAVSPNDKLIVSGSLDKTAKLWHVEKRAFLGTFRGHKRSVWCVQFSPTDQVVATSSADGTIKIWSISDFSCVKTFEGHDTSVLRVAFLTRGMQLLSSGSDGLLKIWSIKDNECLKTFDEHDDKLWALAVSSTENVIATGGADSTIALWQDMTSREWEDDQLKEEENVIKLQKLSNLIQGKNFMKAIGLALTLEQPFRLLQILKSIMDDPTGNSCLIDVIMKLRLDQIDSLLKFCIQWNTNSKHCHVAQAVLNAVLRNFTQDQLLQCANIAECIEGLLPYTDRHFARMNRLNEQSMFVEYTWHKLRMITAPSVQATTDKSDSDETYLIDSMLYSTGATDTNTVPSTSTTVPNTIETLDNSSKILQANSKTEQLCPEHLNKPNTSQNISALELRNQSNNNCLDVSSFDDMDQNDNLSNENGKEDYDDEDVVERQLSTQKNSQRKMLQALVMKMKADRRRSRGQMLGKCSAKKRRKSTRK